MAARPFTLTFRHGTRAAALLGAGAAAALALALTAGTLLSGGVSAQAGTGTVTGTVVWCYGRFGPMPLGPDGATPDAQADPLQKEGPRTQRPMPLDGQTPDVVRRFMRRLPAGAVLVAVQGTAVSTRTDDQGRFTLGGVPAGQYLTVAAGPVGPTGVATAIRPNVLVAAGDTLDLGTLVMASPAMGWCADLGLGVGPGMAFPDGGPTEVPGAAPGDGGTVPQGSPDAAPPLDYGAPQP